MNRQHLACRFSSTEAVAQSSKVYSFSSSPRCARRVSYERRLFPAGANDFVSEEDKMWYCGFSGRAAKRLDAVVAFSDSLPTLSFNAFSRPCVETPDLPHGLDAHDTIPLQNSRADRRFTRKHSMQGRSQKRKHTVVGDSTELDAENFGVAVDLTAAERDAFRTYSLDGALLLGL